MAGNREEHHVIVAGWDLEAMCWAFISGRRAGMHVHRDSPQVTTVLLMNEQAYIALLHVQAETSALRYHAGMPGSRSLKLLYCPLLSSVGETK